MSDETLYEFQIGRTAAAMLGLDDAVGRREQGVVDSLRPYVRRSFRFRMTKASALSMIADFADRGWGVAWSSEPSESGACRVASKRLQQQLKDHLAKEKP